MKRAIWGSCNSNDTQYWPNEKGHWGSCNSNDPQYNPNEKEHLGKLYYTQYNSPFVPNCHLDTLYCVSFELQLPHLSLFIWPLYCVSFELQLPHLSLFNLAIVLCVIRITASNGQMKRHWGNCFE